MYIVIQHIYMYICTYIVYIHIHTLIYIYIYRRTHIYIYTYRRYERPSYDNITWVTKDFLIKKHSLLEPFL